MGQGKFYIPSLDGIRAVAFILVFFSHAGYGHIIPGGFGVTVFFFLSGYLITTLLRREYSNFQKISLKKFYIRRILRIWPPFYYVLFLGCGLTLLGFLGGELELSAVLAQIFHFNNYYGIFNNHEGVALGSDVYWSLAVEEHFYLIFPFLYIWLLRMKLSRSKQAIIFWSLCLGFLIWRCILIFKVGVSPDRIFYSTDARLDSMLFGCALAVYGNPILDLDPQSPKLEQTLQYVLLPISTALLLWTFMSRSVEFRETVRYTIQGLALYPWFTAAICFPNWKIFRVLNLQWVRFLGALSYSLYLVHFTVIFIVQAYFPNLSVFIQAQVALLISFGVSLMIYRFIELPTIKIRKRFASG